MGCTNSRKSSCISRLRRAVTDVNPWVVPWMMAALQPPKANLVGIVNAVYYGVSPVAISDVASSSRKGRWLQASEWIRGREGGDTQICSMNCLGLWNSKGWGQCCSISESLDHVGCIPCTNAAVEKWYSLGNSKPNTLIEAPYRCLKRTLLIHPRRVDQALRIHHTRA